LAKTGMRIIKRKKRKKIEKKPSKFGVPFFFTFILTFLTWVLLSGRFDAFHIGLGVLSCGIISYFSGPMNFGDMTFKALVRVMPRFTMYLPWLFYQVFLANLHVVKLVFHPHMRELIKPDVIQFKSRLKSKLALTTFANSITLTPGTITVYVSNFGEFKVHVIDSHSGEGVPDMEKRIAHIFDE
jgi:multicomponent Na+:H+ antiporter subunit E